jgi:hypothetical protein
MTADELVEMFEGDSADMCSEKFLLILMEGRVELLACTDPGARTPIGMRGNKHSVSVSLSFSTITLVSVWV